MLPDLLPIRRTGWQAVLPHEAVSFMGQPVAIEIDTRIYPDATPIPPVSDSEMHLAQTIVENIQTCLEQCQKLFATDPSYPQLTARGDVNIDNPHIWISRETIQEEGPRRWAFVIGIDVNPDFGWHIEFDNLDALEIWAGD